MYGWVELLYLDRRSKLRGIRRVGPRIVSWHHYLYVSRHRFDSDGLARTCAHACSHWVDGLLINDLAAYGRERRVHTSRRIRGNIHCVLFACP